MGETDGQPKDADWAAAITGVPADTIRALARRMAADRTMMTASWSLQRADHGEQPYWALILLACVPRPDRACRAAASASAMAPPAGIAEPPLAFPAPTMEIAGQPARPRHSGGAHHRLPAAPGRELRLQRPQSDTYPDIRLVYWAGGNPFHHHQDTNRLRGAWRRPETIIVHEPWWTATARHADIVLPATTSLERNDIGGAPRDRFVIAMQQAIEPVGEARNDFAIFSALARRLGCEAAYTEGRDETAWLRHLYERWRDEVRTNQAAIPDFDAFWEDG